MWREVVTNDIEAEDAQLVAAGVMHCDEIEPLPQGFNVFWVSSEVSIIDLVCNGHESWSSVKTGY
jgi:hypothetical protein